MFMYFPGGTTVTPAAKEVTPNETLPAQSSSHRFAGRQCLYRQKESALCRKICAGELSPCNLVTFPGRSYFNV